MTTRTLGRSAVSALAALALTITVAACTKSSPSHVTTSTQTSTSTHPTTSDPTGPVVIGKLTEKGASSCPLLSTTEAKSDAGMRLNKITTLSQNGKLVGCRFYPAVFQSEHLPPPSQVVIEIVISQYANATSAHNAFIRIATSGTNYQQDVIATGNTGLCFQTTLWKPDNGKDWACTFSKGSKVVVIRTVVTDPAFNVVQIAKAVYPKV